MIKIFRIIIVFLMFSFILRGFFEVSQVTHAQEQQSREQLESQLRDIEDQIAAFEKELAVTKTEKQRLTTAIQKLKKEQSILKLQVQSTTILINDLTSKITKTEKAIKENTLRLTELQKQLAELLKLMNQISDNIVLTIFSAKSLSEAYVEYKNYTKVSQAIVRLTSETEKTRSELGEARTNLNDQQDEAEKLLSIKAAQQETLVERLSEESELLTQTKGKEENFQAIVADQKKKAAEIRNRIYELFTGNKTVTFGEAVGIANWVSEQTGVRPAFLLAILTQESNLGKNVGTCNRSGDPPEKSWKVVMKPERDQEPFKTITSELGLDIDTTPVSCPMKNKDGSQLGWGGAMGPAQFIPSTWMGYRAKVTKLTGKQTANPWDIRDAFAAAAIKLKADGATSGGDGEWKAAMRYFSGSTNPKYRFYGDNVIKTANKYEAEIKDISL